MSDSSQIDPVSVAKKFLVFALESPSPSERGLLELLDELAHVYHFGLAAELTNDETDDKEPPKRADDSHKKLCEKLSARFPKLGFYPVPDLFEADKWELLTSDAIDDIAYIAADLQEVIWRSENESETIARWYFRMLFKIHWGKHLRELALYLHCKQTWD